MTTGRTAGVLVTTFARQLDGRRAATLGMEGSVVKAAIVDYGDTAAQAAVTMAHTHKALMKVRLAIFI